jgi:hypothetical protein
MEIIIDIWGTIKGQNDKLLFIQLLCEEMGKETVLSLVRLQVFAAMNVRVSLQGSDVAGYQHFGGPCSLHLHCTLKMEAARSS